MSRSLLLDDTVESSLPHYRTVFFLLDARVVHPEANSREIRDALVDVAQEMRKQSSYLSNQFLAYRVGIVEFGHEGIKRMIEPVGIDGGLVSSIEALLNGSATTTEDSVSFSEFALQFGPRLKRTDLMKAVRPQYNPLFILVASSRGFDDWESGIDHLLLNGWFKLGTRISIVVGDASSHIVDEFASQKGLSFVVGSPEDLGHALRVSVSEVLHNLTAVWPGRLQSGVVNEIERKLKDVRAPSATLAQDKEESVGTSNWVFGTGLGGVEQPFSISLGMNPHDNILVLGNRANQRFNIAGAAAINCCQLNGLVTLISLPDSPIYQACKALSLAFGFELASDLASALTVINQFSNAIERVDTTVPLLLILDDFDSLIDLLGRAPMFFEQDGGDNNALLDVARLLDEGSMSNIHLLFTAQEGLSSEVIGCFNHCFSIDAQPHVPSNAESAETSNGKEGEMNNAISRPIAYINARETLQAVEFVPFWLPWGDSIS